MKGKKGMYILISLLLTLTMAFASLSPISAKAFQITATAPEGFEAKVFSSRVILNWKPEAGAIEYDVEADGKIISNGTNCSYEHKILLPSSKHIYRIRVKDKDGTSNWSNELLVTTKPKENNLNNISKASNGLSNEASNINLNKMAINTTNNDDYGNDFSSAEPIQIGIINNGIMNYTGDTDVFKFTSTDAGKYYVNLTPNFSCSYGVDVYNSSQVQIQVNDDSGWYINADANQTYYIKTIFTGGTGPYTIRVTETSAPTAPSNLKVTQTSTSSITISWLTSTDNVGVSGYEIYRNNTKVGETAQLSYTDIGLASNTEYTYTVKAKDASDNLSAVSSAVTGKTDVDTDTIPPTAPTSLAVTSKTSRSITLSWNPATDNGTVIEYDIYCNGTKAGTATSTSYTCSGLTPNSTYSFKVQARDSAGNISTDSNIVSELTYDDDYGDDFSSAAPIQIGIINNGIMNYTGDTDVFKFTSTDAGKYYINLTPNFSCSYGVDVYNSSQVQIQVNDDNGWYINADANQTYYIRTIFAGGTGSYTIRVTETSAPTAPTDLKITQTSTSSITISWLTSTDNVGVSGYEIYRNNTKVGETAQLSYTDIGLASNTEYTYTVKAKDTSDNLSAVSSAVTGKTDVDIDTIPPTAPANLTVTSKTARSITLSWNPASDNETVIGYDIYCNEIKAGTSTVTSYTCSGLTPGNTYSFKVEARDAAGNISPDSNIIMDTTCDDDYGDDLNSAAPIQIGVINYGMMNYTEDVDTFKFTSLESGKYYIDLTPDFSCSYSVDAYNSSQERIQVYKDKGFYINADANQVYYIKTIFTGGTGPYTLNIKETIPPSAPTNLAVTDTGITTLSISWSGSTDNVAIGGYEIYRNGNNIGKTGASELAFTDTSLDPDTVYTYTVKAIDTSGNLSDPSTGISAKTAIDTIPPTAPTGLQASGITSSGFDLSWSAPTDNVAVVSYDIYQGDQFLGTSTTNYFRATELAPLTTYSITVRSKDAAGNLSDPSEAIQVQTVENEPPTAPTGLAVSELSWTSFILTWNVSTDNIGVTGYDIYNGSNLIGSTTTETKFNVKGLMPNTTYNFIVKAKDAAGNISDASSTLTVATLPDVEAPTVPDGLISKAIAYTTVTLAWNVSTDNVSVTGYDIFNGDNLIGTAEGSVTSYNVTGLAQDTEYHFTVKAKDASGNTSASSTALTVKTAGPADLIITDISYSPDSPCEGEDVTFSATIKNIGRCATPDGFIHKVEFSLDGGDTFAWSDYSGKSVAPGQSITLCSNGGKVSKTWNAIAGSHTVKAIINNENLILEENTENNSYCEKIAIEKPCDLVVSSIIVSPGNPIAGEQVTLKAIIKNIGEGCSPAGRVHTVGFYIDGSTEAEFYADDYNWSIEPWQSVTLTATCGKDSSLWTAITGEHAITAKVDDLNLIKESNEDNNSFTRNITVTDTRTDQPNGDYDGDGLSNEQEIKLGTDPNNPDSDGDGINDFKEIYSYHTNPLNADTDGDGLYDNTEIKMGTDPITVNANNAAQRKTVTADEKIAVTVNGDSNILAAPFKVIETDNKLLSSLKGIVGKPIEISMNGYKFDNADLTIKYDVNELNGTSEDDLTIFWVDPDNKKLVPLPKEDIAIDKTAGTITGKLSHFSTYVLGYDDIQADLPDTDIVFDVDVSYSMYLFDPYNYRLITVNRFADGLDEYNYRMGLVSFTSNGYINQTLTNDKTSIYHNDEFWGYGYNSDFRAGLNTSVQAFDNSSNLKVIVMISDGIYNNNEDVFDGYGYGNENDVIDLCHNISVNKNIIIDTISVGSTIDDSLLQCMAWAAGGKYYSISRDPETQKEQGKAQIERIYSEIINQLKLTGKIEQFSPIIRNNIAQIQSNLCALGYKDAYTNLDSAINCFVSEYYDFDGTNLLKVKYDKLNGDLKITTLLSWTFDALLGSITTSGRSLTGNNVPTNGGYQTFTASINGNTYHYSENTITPYTDLCHMFKDCVAYNNIVQKFYAFCSANNITIDQETKDFLNNDAVSVMQAGDKDKGFGEWVQMWANILEKAYDHKAEISSADFNEATNICRDLIRTSAYGKIALSETQDKDMDVYYHDLLDAIRIVTSDEAYIYGNTIVDIENLKSEAFDVTWYWTKKMESLEDIGSIASGFAIEFATSEMYVDALSSLYNEASASTNLITVDEAIENAEYLDVPSGAISKKMSEMTVDEYLRLQEKAEEMYNGFRLRTDDVAAIARNTGWDESKILQIKNHLFNDDILFKDGISKFAPDYWQAEAWQRLIDGAQNDTDILLLNHELYESNYMKANKCIYDVAHAEANKLYNWSMAVFGE